MSDSESWPSSGGFSRHLSRKPKKQKDGGKDGAELEQCLEQRNDGHLGVGAVAMRKAEGAKPPTCVGVELG